MLEKLIGRNREEVKEGRKKLCTEGVQFPSLPSTYCCSDLKSSLVRLAGMEKKVAQERNVCAVLAVDKSADESEYEGYTSMWFLPPVYLSLRKGSKKVIGKHCFKF